MKKSLTALGSHSISLAALLALGGASCTGADGAPGKDGKDGLDGSVGKAGPAGSNGKDGINGVNGKDGVNGLNGKDGRNGDAGAPGIDGVDGENGEDGVSGRDGIGNIEAAIPGVPHILTLSSTGHDRFYNVTHDAAGSIFAVGQFTSSTDANADVATLVAKFTPSGQLDTTFGIGGLVVRNVANGTNGELFRAIVVQTSGKIVVSGTIEHAGAADARDRDIAAFRLNTDGSIDTSFGSAGTVLLDLSTGVVNGSRFSADSAWGLVVYPDDRLVISGGKVRDGGLDTDFALVRLTPDGARDATFGSNGLFTLDTADNGTNPATPNNLASPRNVTLLPGNDGLIGAGYQPVTGAETGPALFKVTDTGVLDTTFADQGVFHDMVLTDQAETYAAVVQPTGVGNGYKLVTTGYGKELPGDTTDLISLRLTSDGVLDLTYGPNGDGFVQIDVGGFGDNSRNLAVLPDRRIVFVGGGRLSSADVDGVVWKLTPDGLPDLTFSKYGFKTFNLGGPADFLWGLDLLPGGNSAALVGIKGVGTSPTPATANDDAALLLLPL